MQTPVQPPHHALSQRDELPAGAIGLHRETWPSSLEITPTPWRTINKLVRLSGPCCLMLRMELTPPLPPGSLPI